MVKKIRRASHPQASSPSPRRALKQTLILLPLLLAPVPLTALPFFRPVLAQSSTQTFPLPTAVPTGTLVQVDGSSSMATTNQTMKQRFETQFPGTEVKLAYDGTDVALKALLDGKTDLAAIGRPLTEAEKAQGLVAVPVSRSKIAMIVGRDNPFTGSLTDEQFAKIFRGEITNWAAVGGPDEAIRMIDRPETSDTRRAFRNYPVFQSAPFESGANTIKVAEDTTEAVVKALGKDGIGYATVNQVVDSPDVRIVLMHGTPPTDPRYPFSQPLLYVYKGPSPSPAAQAFLGYAMAGDAKVGALATPAEPSPGAVSPSPAPAAVAPADVAPADMAPAIVAPAIVAPAIVAAPDAPAAPAGPKTPFRAPTPDPNVKTYGSVPWWLWWLSIPLLGGLLWWLLKGRGAEVAAGAMPAAIASDRSRIILTPRNCKEGYAYWEVPDAVKDDLRQQGGRRLMVRLYDVTDIDMEHQTPHSVKQFDCNEQAQDLHIPLPLDDRDYIAELGYLTGDGHWLKIARSAHVRVPACPAPTGNGVNVTRAAVAGTAVAAGATVAAGGAVAHSLISQPAVEKQSRIILTPRSSDQAYAYWEAPEEHKAALRRQGGRRLFLQIHDTTDIDLDEHSAHSTQQYECDEQAQDRHVPIPVANRDYVAELGYVTENNRWLKLARSQPARVPAAGVILDGAKSNVVAPATSSVKEVDSIPVANLAQPAGAAIAGASVAGAAIAGAAIAGVAMGAGKAAQSFLDNGQPAGQSDRTEIEANLIVHSQRNCFRIDPDAMAKLQNETAVSRTLQPGTYTIKLKDGAFDYRAESGHPGEPWVLLWLYGGKVVNHQTGVEVGATWVSLNGHGDTVTIDVREPATLCAFFLDTYLDDNEGEVTVSVEEASIADLTVHSQRNCYYIDPQAMKQLEETAVSRTLQPGTYTIKLKEGAFGYRSDLGFQAEPLVLLWIYGGKVVNHQTNVEVGATWSSLNGYGDTLTLEVRESATLCAFFYDTYLEDNTGEVVLSLQRLSR